jgi:hemerythrin-like domain-containing protein
MGGNMDVIDLLVADHNRARGLIARYKDAREADKTDEAAALSAELITELRIHMAAEEEVFYRSAQTRSSEISDDVDEGFEEHHVAKVLIDEIEALDAGSDSWVAKMTVLIENVEHHVDEEEDELFPEVRSSSEAGWRRELGDELESVKGKLGAPALADKLELSKSELVTLARDQKIPGRSSMDHDELAATVSPE